MRSHFEETAGEFPIRIATYEMQQFQRQIGALHQGGGIFLAALAAVNRENTLAIDDS